MRLAELLKDVRLDVAPGFDPVVTGIAHDSRKVRQGDVFFALPGLKADGSFFAAEAVSRGAAAIVSEKPVNVIDPVCVIVRDARLALAIAASNMYERPHEFMTLVGITGTNGKTTTSYIFEKVSEAAGRSCGVIGTVEYRYGGHLFDAPHTTPEAIDLARMFDEMRRNGTDTAVMEVSSHALAMHRVGGMAFDAVAFTNLTRDHLDYHGGMDSYFETKSRLFRPMPLQGKKKTVAVINLDDPSGRRIAGETGFEVIGVSAGDDATAAVRPVNVNISIDGIDADIKLPTGSIGVHSDLVGRHNLMNVMTAAGLAHAVGMGPDAIAKGIARLKGVPGRLERIDTGSAAACFVDYAHTDDALKNVLSTIRELKPERVITVFGCGGDRDRGKRPMMGRAAASMSDIVIVTSDNPRTENPMSIIDEIVLGIDETGFSKIGYGALNGASKGYAVIESRAAAIDAAAAGSRPGDVVLIAGKGHEDYQIIGTKKHHFSDREEAERAFGTTSGVKR